MNKKILAIATSAIAVFSGACSSPKTPADQTPSTPAAQEPIASEPVSVNENNVVIYTDTGYEPSTLNLKVGETVTFRNDSSHAMWTASDAHPSHTTYDGTNLSEHCNNPSATTFDECKSAQPGEEWSFTFTKAGSWKYHNHVRPGDTGTITAE